MTLSADKLNLRSPYQLTQINDLTFSFVTDKQIHYNVGSLADVWGGGLLVLCPAERGGRSSRRGQI